VTSVSGEIFAIALRLAAIAAVIGAIVAKVRSLRKK
jgi:hypothetical protein